MLAGASSVLSAEGCALVGGHTSEAAEGDPSPAMGLSVTGNVLETRVLKKSPLVPGMSLVLTKAIGTGVLMVADMKGILKAEWLHGALTSMLRSNSKAADILRQHGCTVCTDVTGFGLIGHLLEMLSSDGSVSCTVDLLLDHVPVLRGARECTFQGLQSSLYVEVSNVQMSGYMSKSLFVFRILLLVRRFKMQIYGPCIPRFN